MLPTQATHAPMQQQHQVMFLAPGQGWIHPQALAMAQPPPVMPSVPGHHQYGCPPGVMGQCPPMPQHGLPQSSLPFASAAAFNPAAARLAMPGPVVSSVSPRLPIPGPARVGIEKAKRRPTGPMVKCMECKRSFASNYLLQKHMLRIHHKGEPKHPCPKCKVKGYHVLEDLTMHLKTCGKQICCLSCGFRARQRRTMERHAQTYHAGARYWQEIEHKEEEFVGDGPFATDGSDEPNEQ